MSPIATLLWTCNLIMDTCGQLSFKAAAQAPDELDGLKRWRFMLGNSWLWFGLATYVIEFFVYLAFMSNVPLSQGVLMGSVNIVAVMLGGRILFDEKLTFNRILATCLIATGVALVGWGKV